MLKDSYIVVILTLIAAWPYTLTFLGMVIGILALRRWYKTALLLALAWLWLAIAAWEFVKYR